MEQLKTFPVDDGFFMPAEFHRHAGTIMIWPERPGSWGKDPIGARRAFAEIIIELSRTESVMVAVGARGMESAREMLPETVQIIEVETDDSWARDIAPTFVKSAEGDIRGINWRFNAWGGEHDGLYASYVKDNAFAEAVCEVLGFPCYDAQDFVLEGGAIHADGEGTVLVTEACLLSKGRNPHLSREEIEDKLKKYLGAQKIIWLPNGIYKDETNEHVDNVCAFIRPGEVVLAWTDNQEDPQYAMSQRNLEVLQRENDAKGRNFTVHKLPIPDFPVRISEADCEDFEFEEGEDMREAGERLAASYVNFYFANEIILLPMFGGENEESDRRAVRMLSKICPEHKVVPIDAQAIIKGGGNIHCITQQIPAWKG